jgi:4-hydroxyphenylpyruvate dioxygenase-like putative hemolysin
MSVVLRPAEALARAVERLAAQGFAVVARNTRGDSVYLKTEACAFALRVSNHARTAKQRKNHPDAITSLVLRDPTSEAALAEAVAVAVRNFAGERAKREREMGANGPSQA